MNRREMTNTDNHPLFHLRNLLGTSKHRVVCSNTQVVDWGDRIELKLHGHTIMKVGASENLGTIKLFSCGWRTVTTKDRLNRVLPYGARVWQDNYVWYLHDALGVREFHEGIQVHLEEQ